MEAKQIVNQLKKDLSKIRTVNPEINKALITMLSNCEVNTVEDIPELFIDMDGLIIAGIFIGNQCLHDKWPENGLADPIKQAYILQFAQRFYKHMKVFLDNEQADFNTTNRMHNE